MGEFIGKTVVFFLEEVTGINEVESSINPVSCTLGPRSIVVSTPRCGRGDAGSIPAVGNFLLLYSLFPPEVNLFLFLLIFEFLSLRISQKVQFSCQ